jgi:hypothetical protein
MIDAWRSLVMLGTDRAGTPVAPPHPLLARPFEGLDWNDKEGAFLAAASLWAVASAAGAAAADGATTPAPCPPESAPVAPPAAARALAAMLSGVERACLPEWLALAAERGLIAPARRLPALLDLGARETALREGVRAVVGARGRWLARREASWEWVAGDATPDDVAWETGTLPERVRWLKLRAAADPAAAGEALRAVWDAEDGDGREALIGALADRPCASLAAWLEERPLRDRRAAIRAAARALLAQLADAPFTARAIARATPLVGVEGLLKKRLVLRPPEAFDPAWRADGVEEKPPTGLGPRAYWARQLLAPVPLAHWERRFGVDAATLFAWNRDEDSRRDLAAAFVAGESLRPTAAAAVAFAKSFLVPDGWPLLVGEREEFAAAWFPRLPAAAATAAAAALVAASPADELIPQLLLRRALPSLPDPRVLRAPVAAVLDRPHAVASTGESLAAALPFSALPDLLALFASRAALASSVEAFVRTAEFRRSLRAAFAAPEAP